MFTWCRQFKLSFCRCYLFAIRFIIFYYKYTIYFALANRNALPEKIKKSSWPLWSSCIDNCIDSIVLQMNNLLKLGKWNTASHNVEGVFLRWWPLSCLDWPWQKVLSFWYFIDKISLDDNDDDDVDDDADYEKITSPSIHNLSIVFLSKLRTIEMYIKNQRTFKNYLSQYLLGDSQY